MGHLDQLQVDGLLAVVEVVELHPQALDMVPEVLVVAEAVVVEVELPILAAVVADLVEPEVLEMVLQELLL